MSSRIHKNHCKCAVKNKNKNKKKHKAVLLSSASATREEVELILPPLEPQYCVEQAMNAILIDQPLVCIPRITYLPVLSRA